MATWKFKGLDKYVIQLERLSRSSKGQIKMAVYDGAAAVANNIKSALDTIPVQDHFIPKGTMRTGITEVQKQGLIKGFGLSPMETKNSYVNTKAGFSGKNADGENNATVMRRVESGTSYMRKNPVIRNATKKAKTAAEAAMKATLEREIRKSMF